MRFRRPEAKSRRNDRPDMPRCHGRTVRCPSRSGNGSYLKECEEDRERKQVLQASSNG